MAGQSTALASHSISFGRWPHSGLRVGVTCNNSACRPPPTLPISMGSPMRSSGVRDSRLRRFSRSSATAWREIKGSWALQLNSWRAGQQDGRRYTANAITSSLGCLWSRQKGRQGTAGKAAAAHLRPAAQSEWSLAPACKRQKEHVSGGACKQRCCCLPNGKPGSFTQCPSFAPEAHYCIHSDVVWRQGQRHAAGEVVDAALACVVAAGEAGVGVHGGHAGTAGMAGREAGMAGMQLLSVAQHKAHSRTTKQFTHAPCNGRDGCHRIHAAHCDDGSAPILLHHLPRSRLARQKRALQVAAGQAGVVAACMLSNETHPAQTGIPKHTAVQQHAAGLCMPAANSSRL